MLYLSAFGGRMVLWQRNGDAGLENVGLENVSWVEFESFWLLVARNTALG